MNQSQLSIDVQEEYKDIPTRNLCYNKLFLK